MGRNGTSGLYVLGSPYIRGLWEPVGRILLLLVGGGAKEEQQRLNLSGTLCRPSIRPITIFHRFFFFCFIQISLLVVFSKPSGLLQILSQ